MSTPEIDANFLYLRLCGKNKLKAIALIVSTIKIAKHDAIDGLSSCDHSETTNGSISITTEAIEKYRRTIR